MRPYRISAADYLVLEKIGGLAHIRPTDPMYLMNVSHTVDGFVFHGQELVRLLRYEGDNLTDLDLQTILFQLHVIEIEAANLKTFRQLLSKNRAASQS